jgi:hypothetical protein
MPTFDEFKTCCFNQRQLQVEAVEFAFEPLKDCVEWFKRQPDKLRLFISTLVTIPNKDLAVQALKGFLIRAVAVVATAELIVALGAIAEFLIAACVGIGLALLMDTLIQCLNLA